MGIVSTNDGVSEYILTKNNEGGVKGDQSENEIDSGLVTLESTADFLTRSATVTIPREFDDRFSFPFDPTGNTNTLVVTMITAKADYYEHELFFHGSQCKAFESLALTVEGGSKRHKESSKRRKESSLFADLDLEGDAATKELTVSEMLFGAVLLVVAAFAIDQLRRWSTSDGSKLQVSTGDEEDAPLLNADKAGRARVSAMARVGGSGVRTFRLCKARAICSAARMSSACGHHSLRFCLFVDSVSTYSLRCNSLRGEARQSDSSSLVLALRISPQK